MAKKTVRYLLIAFLWTWAFWIFASFLSASLNRPLVTNATIFALFSPTPDSGAFAPQLIFALGVFGPLIGYQLVATKQKGTFIGHLQSKSSLLAFLIPVAITVPGFLLSAFLIHSEGSALTFGQVVITVGLYFLSNLLTSGTEEFGWRGFLYPTLRQTNDTFWNIAWKGGFIWAVWHYPLMIFLYWGLGIAVALPTLIGFTAGIVAMAYLSNYVYEQTQSIALLMGMHALNNTLNFTLLLLYPNTPFTFVSSLASWGLVIYLEKKHPIASCASA